MTDMLVDSLRGRVRAMNELWQRAVSDMTLEQVNHHERDGVLPIAFSLSHYVRGQHQAVSRMFLGETPVWDTGGWAERVGVSVDQLGREESVEQMQTLRFKDFEAWKEYQSQVVARTQGVLDGLTTEQLAHVVLPKLPPNFLQTFCAMAIGPDAPFRRLEVMECFVFQHGIRHMGELEHARALVGLGGMTS